MTESVETATEVAEPVARRVVSVPLHKIVCFDEPPKRGAIWALLKNMRKTSSPVEDEELAREILANGLQQPIRIAPLPKGVAAKNGEEFFVVFGSRRYKAMAFWMEQVIRRDHEEAFDRAVAREAKAKEEGKEYREVDRAAWNAKLLRALDAIPRSIDSSFIDTDDPIAIAAENYRENAHRIDPHWADFVDRVGEFLAAGLDERSIAKVTGKSLKHIQNLSRVAQKLAPDILEKARGETEEPRLTLTQAIRLAKYDDHETQREQLRMLTEEPSDQEREAETTEGGDSGESGESSDTGAGSLTVRPKPDELEAVVADINTGGYDNVAPKALPKGTADLKQGFGLGYTEGWKEGAALGLRWAAGKRKTFPKPTAPE